jgi:hypothetical protein
MATSETSIPMGKVLPALLISYGAASLLHFVHNAEFLTDYPGMPTWLTRAQVYVIWLCITTLGVLGYILRRRGHELAGHMVLAVYAAFGLDSLLHYGLAPFAAHTPAMNLTILFEVTTAALVLIAVVSLATKRLRRSIAGRDQ